jgi:hypothetical protein
MLSNTIEQHDDMRFWISGMQNDNNRTDYRINVKTQKFEISGILIVARIDNSWRGIMMNEFGVKLFDFISTSKKCKLLNVFALADKWYIKRTLASDLQFMLEIDNSSFKKGRVSNRVMSKDILTITHKHKRLQRFPCGEFILYNEKRGLTYTLNTMQR